MYIWFISEHFSDRIFEAIYAFIVYEVEIKFLIKTELQCETKKFQKRVSRVHENKQKKKHSYTRDNCAFDFRSPHIRSRVCHGYNR